MGILFDMSPFSSEKGRAGRILRDGDGLVIHGHPRPAARIAWKRSDESRCASGVWPAFAEAWEHTDCQGWIDLEMAYLSKSNDHAGMGSA